MPRPYQCRQVEGEPKVSYFKPRGVPLTELGETRLSVEGLEALRLADMEGLSMAEASALMGVSRHTFGRVLAAARQAVSQALVQGRALRIEGGHFALKPGGALPTPSTSNPSKQETS